MEISAALATEMLASAYATEYVLRAEIAALKARLADLEPPTPTIDSRERGGD